MSVVALAAVAAGLTIVGGIQQKNQLDAQAKAFSRQADLVQAEGDRQEALERASTAQEGFERSRDLQRVIGNIMARGANAGFGVVGTVGTKIRESGSEFAKEQDLRLFNLNQRLASLSIGTTTQVNSLKAQSSVFKSQGNSALVSSLAKATGTLSSGLQFQSQLGSVPDDTWANGDPFKTS